MKERSLTEGRIAPALVRFAVPFLLASLLQSFYGAADMFMVGKFSGSAAVSAVSTGSQIFTTITSTILGLCTGGTVLIAQKVGEKNDDGAAKAVGTMAVAFAVAGIVLVPVMLALAGPMTKAMQAPAEAFEFTKQYVMICACGVPFILGYNVTAGIFRGMGDSRTPVLFIFIACVINIVGDYILVGVLGLGAAGAALATIFAQGSSFILSVIYMVKRGLSFPFSRRYIAIDKPSLKWLLRVGTPLAFQSAFISISFLLITAIINAMGLVASAAVGVTEKLISFFMLPASSFSAATATMVAQNIGARKPERAMNSMICSMAVSFIIGTALTVYTQFDAESLTAIFSKDPEVIRAAALYLRSYSLDCIVVSFVFNLNSYFSGCGRSMVTMAHNVAATFLVRVPFSYFVSRMEGATLYHIGLAAPLASVFSVAVCIIYFIYLKRNGKLCSI